MSNVNPAILGVVELMGENYTGAETAPLQLEFMISFQGSVKSRVEGHRPQVPAYSGIWLKIGQELIYTCGTGKEVLQ